MESFAFLGIYLKKTWLPGQFEDFFFIFGKVMPEHLQYEMRVVKPLQEDSSFFTCSCVCLNKAIETPVPTVFGK